ncbi:hypothetical protein DPMN_137337 [Dreissena polymorpha]|uniref:Uncharacterized protein n=1 Tax=Dreissena polymorpha TaxID=45954 RepID=A0A9D4G1M4_DREPO|nr:hypothetical protein DPMN_137337 [Dreissena polymorpha]
MSEHFPKPLSRPAIANTPKIPSATSDLQIKYCAPIVRTRMHLIPALIYLSFPKPFSRPALANPPKMPSATSDLPITYSNIE